MIESEDEKSGKHQLRHFSDLVLDEKSVENFSERRFKGMIFRGRFSLCNLWWPYFAYLPFLPSRHQILFSILFLHSSFFHAVSLTVLLAASR